jgi:hypothetical protein
MWGFFFKENWQKNSRMDLLHPAVQINNISGSSHSYINHRFVPCQLQSIHNNTGPLLKPPTLDDHTHNQPDSGS